MDWPVLNIFTKKNIKLSRPFPHCQKWSPNPTKKMCAGVSRLQRTVNYWILASSPRNYDGGFIYPMSAWGVTFAQTNLKNWISATYAREILRWVHVIDKFIDKKRQIWLRISQKLRKLSKNWQVHVKYRIKLNRNVKFELDRASSLR